MNPFKPMKMTCRNWQYWLVVLMTAIAGMAVRADNPPIQWCAANISLADNFTPGTGAFTSSGLLNKSTIDVFVGQPISPSTLAVNPVFSNGLLNYSIQGPDDCQSFITNGSVPVTYSVGNLYFVPPIPSAINSPGTNTYIAKVIGTAPQYVTVLGPGAPYYYLYLPVCTGSWASQGDSGIPFVMTPPPTVIANTIANKIGTVTIRVWSPGDSDYDGVCDLGEAEAGTDPYNPSSVQDVLLGYWRFDNTSTWAGEEGQLPITSANIAVTPSFSGTAVVVDTNGAVLQYRDVEPNAITANINLRRGTVELWFKADWNSASTNNGVGPQGDGRLIEMGAPGASGGWWALRVGAAGTNLYFCTQTNVASTLTTNLSATINWVSNQWHQVVLTYSTNNSSLYLDGLLVMTNGLGVASYPGPTVRAQGFTIGGSASGGNQARGAFDELQTFNYPLDADTVLGQYQTTIINNPGLDVDGDGVPNGNDADPNDPSVGALPFAIRISQPAGGSMIY